MEEKFNYFEMVGSLISAYKENRISDIDLFNSIIRLVYSTSAIDKEALKNVVDWFNFHEEKNTPPEVQYSAQNVKENVGQDYFEGLMLILSKDIHTEEHFKNLSRKLKNI